MFFEIEAPLQMDPRELDRRLARGWFRSGPVLFRASMLHLEGDLRPLVHLRIRLAHDPPSRSRRRLLRRNRERFRLDVGPARVDPARERLYQATKPRFLGFVSRELEPLVYGELPGAFDTREICVYDGSRLVAVSYFDLGRRSIASVLGLHDPEYARASLGIYTMLEEMELARSLGLRFYYPGYVIPGLPGLDYKLRLGDTQYLVGESRWRAAAGIPRRSRRVARVERRTRAMEHSLRTRQMPHERRSYPFFWLGHLPDADRPYLRAPVHLRCHPAARVPRPLVVEYLAEEDRFLLSRVAVRQGLDAAEGLEPNPDLEASAGYELRPLVYRERICVHDSEERVANAALAAWSAPAR